MILRVVLITSFLIRSHFSCLHSCRGVRVCAEVPGGGASYGEGCVPTCPGECPFHWWDWCYCHQEFRRSDWRYELVYTASVCMSFMLMFPSYSWQGGTADPVIERLNQMDGFDQSVNINYSNVYFECINKCIRYSCVDKVCMSEHKRISCIHVISSIIGTFQHRNICWRNRATKWACRPHRI